MIEHPASRDDYFKAVGSGTAIVDFSAQWCGPCKMIGPFFEELSNKYTSLKFVKVDVDELEDVSSEVGVRYF